MIFMLSQMSHESNCTHSNGHLLYVRTNSSCSNFRLADHQCLNTFPGNLSILHDFHRKTTSVPDIMCQRHRIKCGLGREQLSVSSAQSEAEFLDIIGTKVFRVFLLAIYSHLCYRFYSPFPLSKSGLKLVCNVNIYLKSENSPDMPRNLNGNVRSRIRLQM